MKTIHQLSPDLVAKIAAGEIVEHPASVVKELVENSLDAEATQIDIELTDGGLDKILIRDNGKGMSKEDIEVCFLPHTTSKIMRSDDLLNILSFGFRGEAIWSIAAVSHITIKSREFHADHGWQIELQNGKIIHSGAAGIPTGTEITVSSLFHSTPARKKFLKDTTTETRQIIDVILQFALAFPHVGFELSHNGKLLLSLPKQQEHTNRLQAVIGDYMASHSIPFSHQNRYGKVWGFLGRPQISGRNRSHQYVFVNNRAVSPLQFSKYISLAYGNLIEPRSHPVFVLFLDLPFDHVDVNVHPRKEQVACMYEQELANLIQEAIGETLNTHNLTYRDTSADTGKGMDFTLASMLRETLTPWNVKQIDEDDIVQINNLYLLAPIEKGLLLIDQHAAHERILYEQFLEAFQTKKNQQEIYNLHEPVLVEVAKNDALLLEQELEKLQDIGFDIESFGPTTFKISAVPDVFKNRDYAMTIIEIIADMKVYGSPTSKVMEHIHTGIDKETDRTLSFLACRTAIKGGEALSRGERKRLVDKLLELEAEHHTGYTCPHGRPTHIEISLTELDRMFKRKI